MTLVLDGKYNQSIYNKLNIIEHSIFEATPILELPSKSSIKWGKYRKKQHFHRGYEVTLRNREHIKVIESAGISRKKCQSCGIISEWENFHVHHINGQHDDNRLENLVVLCRDCHIDITNGYPMEFFPSDYDGIIFEGNI